MVTLLTYIQNGWVNRTDSLHVQMGALMYYRDSKTDRHRHTHTHEASLQVQENMLLPKNIYNFSPTFLWQVTYNYPTATEIDKVKLETYFVFADIYIHT